MIDRSVVLTGFMGAGKTTTGELAAATLGRDSQDTDRWMRTEWGMDIPKAVVEDPAAFRAREALALQIVLNREATVVATGGGIVSTEIGRRSLNAARVPIIWLSAPFEVHAERVAQDPTPRPLFDDVDKARALFEERQPWYEETATHVVDATRSESAMALEIVKIALDANRTN